MMPSPRCWPALRRCALVLWLAACGAQLDEPCDPSADPGDCDWLGGYACVSCASLGYASTQGYCYFEDAASEPFAHLCREAWGEPGSGGGGGSSCSGDTSGCPSAWTGPSGDHARYNCEAACYERAQCNEPGVKANCDILASYGGSTASSCTTCR